MDPRHLIPVPPAQNSTWSMVFYHTLELNGPEVFSLMFECISVELAERDDYLAEWAFTLTFTVSLATHRWVGILVEIFLASPPLHL